MFPHGKAELYKIEVLSVNDFISPDPLRCTPAQDLNYVKFIESA